MGSAVLEKLQEWFALAAATVIAVFEAVVPPWFRGRTGSVVGHWGVAVFGTSLGHGLPWSWGAEVAAVVILAAFVAREVWKDGSDTDAMIEDLFGPSLNALYVLVL